MREEPIHFYSDGYKLVGTLYFPDNLQEGEQRPAVVACSGYLGLNEIYPRLFASYLTQAGYITLGFDYRGNGKSEGKHGRILIEEQLEDIKNSLTFIRAQPNVNANSVALIGWGMGAGECIQVTAGDDRVCAVAALNGFYNGRAFLQARHSEEALAALYAKMEHDRMNRVLHGSSDTFNDPFEVYPLDPDTEDEVNQNLAPVPDFGPQTSFKLLESLIGFNAEKVVDDITPRPIFIAHGELNRLHPFEDAYALYRRARNPVKLYRIQGKHNDFMRQGNPEFEKLMTTLTDWLVSHTGQPA
jgi:uncharacterized protein